jgi:DNA primase
MANYVKSDACPDCGSGMRGRTGARAEYDDGSFYCHSCNTYTPPPWQVRLKPRKSGEKTIKVIDTSQWQYSLPAVAREWLAKYQITDQEINQYGLRWNPALTSRQWDGETGALAMPLFENGRVVCVSYRLFDPDKTKSITLGYRPYITFSNIEQAETAVVVEDYISAIKVARIVPCVPLLGSNLPDDALLRLCKGYKRLLIWLDHDKTATALKIASKARLVGLETGVICTELDPKELSDTEIFNRLSSYKEGSLNNYKVF